MKKQAFSILLSAALLLTGCGNQSAPAATRAPSAEAPAAAEKTYFRDDVRHADVPFSEMEYEHYEAAWFDELVAPIYTLAESGGSADAFREMDDILTDELYYVCTLSTLAALKQSADPADDSAAAEAQYAEDLYYTVSDAYWQAMQALAVSPYASLIEDVYGADWVEYFADYEGTDEEDLSLSRQESALVSEYYRLMAQDEIDTDAVADVYLQLVELRNTVAELYDYDSYADYAYDAMFYRDYGPAEAETVWEGAKTYFAPLIRAYEDEVLYAAAFLQSDPRLDCGPETILDAIGNGAAGLSEELYAAYAYLRNYGLYDIDYDPGKAETGYTAYLYDYDEPFIFNCPYGEFYDYLDTIHEFGHFTNAFYNPSDLLYGYSDLDLSELQSQGMEMMFTQYYGDIFGRYADAARDYVLMNMVRSVVNGAMYDEFQQRLYAETDLTAERVNEIFAALYEEYGYEPYEGYETEWMYVSHNFENPFYYISYGVSALGALELFRLLQTDRDAAVDKYLTVCAMDTEEYYLSEALAESGLSSVFALDTYRDVAAAVEAELAS